jgi:hypothetical protein
MFHSEWLSAMLSLDYLHRGRRGDRPLDGDRNHDAARGSHAAREPAPEQAQLRAEDRRGRFKCTTIPILRKKYGVVGARTARGACLSRVAFAAASP